MMPLFVLPHHDSAVGSSAMLGQVLASPLVWWQWAIVLAIPPLIVALYFLKLRRQPVEVPSTYLWARTVEDLHVNSLWQRLRQSLLLFLQLALIALIAVSLLNPGCAGTALVGNRFIILLDTSASMSATDGDGSRLDRAKAQARELIEAMEPDDVAMVMTVSDEAQILQEFTDSRAALRRAVESVRPTERPSNLTEALAAAAGVANPIRTGQEGQGDILAAAGIDTTLYLISDGSVPPVSNVSLGEKLKVEFLQVGTPEAENVAVTAMSVERNPERPDQFQVFARIANTSQAARTVPASLYRDDGLLDAAEIVVQPGQETGYTFALTPDETGRIAEGALRLELEIEDDLALDNVGYLPLNPQRKARVLLITTGQFALEAALATRTLAEISDLTVESPAHLDTEAYKTASASAAYDLIVYDRVAPAVMPQASTVFLGTVPPAEVWTVGDEQGPPVILALDRAHPLTRFVEMSNVIIERGRVVTGPPGTLPLIEADIGTLAALATRAGYEDLVIGFGLDVEDDDGRRANTNWPTKSSFPLFWQNVVEHLSGTRGSIGTETSTPGQPIRLRMNAPVPEILVTDPAGQVTRLARDRDAGFVFTGTNQRGFYTAATGPNDPAPRRFAVNLFDPRESDLTPRDVQIGEATTVTASSATVRSRQEYWKYAALLGLALLVFEWWIYNRRVYL